jgi:hypothetical protein
MGETDRMSPQERLVAQAAAMVSVQAECSVHEALARIANTATSMGRTVEVTGLHAVSASEWMGRGGHEFVTTS